MRAFLLCLLAVSAIASEVKENTKSHNRRNIIADPPVPSIEVLQSSSVAFSNDHSDSGLASGYSTGLNPPVGGDSSTVDSVLSAAVASEYSPGLISGVSTGYANGLNAGLTNAYANGLSSGLNAGIVNSYTANGLDNGIVGGRQIINGDEQVPRTVVNRVVQVAVPVPQRVEVTRDVPVRVPVPVQVEHRRPVPVRVLQPYPVHVDRPYIVNVDRPVPVSVLHAVRVTYPRVAVPVPVPQAYAVPLQQASAGLPWVASSSSLNYANQAAGLGAYATSSGSSGLKSYVATNADNSAGWSYGAGATTKW